VATITLGTGNNTSAPNATKIHVVGDDTTGRATGVVIAYSDGSGSVVTSDADGVLVQGTTTLEGVSNDTATRGTVADTASSTTIISSDAARLGFSIVNTSSAVLYLAFGGTASTTNHVIQLAQGQECSMYGIGIYTGDIVGVWASDPGAGVAVWSWW
jgi:hypothetical protein